MNKYLLALSGLSIIAVYLLLLFPSTPEAVSPEMQIEVVDTEAARIQGLSGRAEIPDAYGMLFVFPHADTYGFWMKDMLVSIDIIWLREDGSIAGIEHSVSPDTYPTSFYAPEPVRYVLETRAGYAKDMGWDIGTRVPIQLP